MLTLACGDEGDSVWNADDDAASTDAAATDAAVDPDDEGGSTDGTAGDGASVDDESDGGTKLDVGAPDTGGFDGCGCDLSYIWVANSEEGTVSKINTKTVLEEGRYLTRPDGSGDPSRTSVNLAGDVAVANRYGGLTKFYADVDRCVDRNGDGVIQTSTGKGDVLAWEAEECRAWFAEFPNTTNQRPVAWTGGVAGPDSCDATEADVWTITSAAPGFPGLGGTGGVIAYRVDGETGLVDTTVAVPAFNGASFGAYGGAVDTFGNLWFTSLGFGSGGQLGRIDADTLVPTVTTTPSNVQPYGITVDHKGRPWLSSTLGSNGGRYDPETATWAVVEGFGGGSGLAESPDGLFMYITQGNGVGAFDLETLEPGGSWTTDQSVKGVGFDSEGYLWAVTWADPDVVGQGAPAYKVDVDTMTVNDVYTGLDNPYTYSDMTGSALGNVTCPPAG